MEECVVDGVLMYQFLSWSTMQYSSAVLYFRLVELLFCNLFLQWGMVRILA